MKRSPGSAPMPGTELVAFLRRTARGIACKARPGRCQRRLEAALRDATAEFKPFQVDKALALIASGGLTATNKPGIYRARSRCTAGQHEHPCYHRAGVALLEAHRSAA